MIKPNCSSTPEYCKTWTWH